MSRKLADLFAALPDLLGGHLLLSVSALLVGLLVSIPLGAVASRRAGLRGPLLTVAGLIQTVPTLALLALMVPLLGGRIGFLPAFLALTLYSILPMLRNTVTGLLDVDAAIKEAARGVGMTDRQSLLRVEMPLAAPVIIAGIRTATVWVVGMATLATPVGAPSLGHYIFLGLQTRNWGAVLFGCAAAAALAIVLDQIIRALEHAARTRNRTLRRAALGTLAVVVVAGLAPLAMGRLAGAVGAMSSSDVRATAPPFDGRTLTVGTKGFTEQYILGDLIRRQLEARGATVASRPNLGSTILFDALRENTVDVCVDYSGTIWATIMKREDPVDRIPMLIDMAAYLKNEHGVITLGPLGFENAYCLAMRRDRAEALGIRSIGDLHRHADGLTVGGDPEVFGRPEWTRVRDAYGLGGVRTRGMDSTFLYGAVRDGQVDVITAYSSDGRIDAFDLVVLRDPQQAFPPYDAILLLSPRAAKTTGLIEALRPLLQAISDTRMRAANRAVDIDERSPSEAAEDLWRDLQVGR